MAVSSGNRKLERMVVDHQDFPVGELFRYSPLSEPGVEMVLSAECIPDDACTGTDFCKRCRINKYCLNEENITQNGRNFVPQCSMFGRKDRKSVYFKEDYAGI